MSTQPKPFLTPEEYLAIEREAETKSEYWNGEMFPMSGARRPGDRAGASARSREIMAFGMSAQPKPFLTTEEYLAIEREAEIKSEYWDGQMLAMPRVGRAHIIITTNTTAQLVTQLASRPCETYAADMRMRTPDGLCTYPDVVVVCDEPRFLDDTQDTQLNPSLIVEVQSLSTEAYDRGKKFELYRGIESLHEYLMISSERVHAELYTRQPSGQWLLTDAASLEDELALESCGCRLKLADLYRKVEFTEPAA